MDMNLDIIHAQCQESQLTKSVKEYKTIRESDFKFYPKKRKTRKYQ